MGDPLSATTRLEINVALLELCCFSLCLFIFLSFYFVSRVVLFTRDCLFDEIKLYYINIYMHKIKLT